MDEELRRPEKCIRIFPDAMSCLQLFGAILQAIQRTGLQTISLEPIG